MFENSLLALRIGNQNAGLASAARPLTVALSVESDYPGLHSAAGLTELGTPHRHVTDFVRHRRR
ncbi:hypothetical protein [Burkholderia singularis]|uniref:hypothetical protein n=1 Tax=Burkholderia singularis TaxID=1503053 RepID=UPI00117E05DD|nr:hypothetical protein [Burkholderia singularis]